VREVLQAALYFVRRSAVSFIYPLQCYTLVISFRNISHLLCVYFIVEKIIEINISLYLSVVKSMWLLTVGLINGTLA
jgi:hypothetical protein